MADFGNFQLILAFFIIKRYTLKNQVVPFQLIVQCELAPMRYEEVVKTRFDVVNFGK